MSKKEEVKEITQEELQAIQTNQTELQKHLSNIGFLEVQKGNSLGAIAQLEKDMSELKQKLEETYGAVNIDVKTGEYTEIPEEEKTKLKKAE